MSKASDNANAVVRTVIDCAALYGVKYLRMQSRVFTVPGAYGRSRPFFIGQWVDDFGKEHKGGMADLLLRPRVPARYLFAPGQACFKTNDVEAVGEVLSVIAGRLITIPLWIECKAGKGRLTPDQEAYRHYVMQNGEAHLVIHDDVRPLIDWFEAHGVKK